MNYPERFKCSLLPDKDDPRDFNQSHILASYSGGIKVPSRVSFADRLPMIQNQLNLGACAHFAFVRIAAVFDPKILFSPMFSYFFTRLSENGKDNIGEDTGSTLRGTLKAANRYGWTLEELWGYLIDKFAIEPSEAAQLYALMKRNTKKVVYYRAYSANEVRFGMAMGYVPYLGIKITDSFYSEETMKTGLILPPSGKHYGLHGVMAPIYDDDLKNGCSVIDNSWGDSVGDKGHFYLPYETFSQVVDAAWMVKIIDVGDSSEKRT